MQPQTVIDMNSGEDHVISYNTITNCEWFTQIKIFEDRDGEVVNNCSIVGNIITKLGGQHDTSVLYFDTNGGDMATVKDNVIDCPGLTQNAIGIRDTRNVIVQGNVLFTMDLLLIFRTVPMLQRTLTLASMTCYDT